MMLLALFALAVQQAAAAKTIEVSLEPKAPSPGENLTWSPKGAKVELKKDGNALVGAFPLGPAGIAPIHVRLEHSSTAVHFDVLLVDFNRDGRFDAAERLTTTPKDNRGKWWSSFEGSATVPFAATGSTRAENMPYPMSLWFVEDPQEPAAAPALRWSRRGWFEGKTTIDGKPVFLLITELEMDGVFTTADSWALATDRKMLLSAGSRPMTAHCWLEERAFKVVKQAADGRTVTLTPFDPTTTEAEEKARADIYRQDREAVRATQPLAFGADFAAALKQAGIDKKRVFVDFSTTWCGPCKVMDQWVYTAADVVSAAADIVCVKLDGDAERELVKRFAVAGYPTMLLLASDGAEVRRLVGYRSVAEMVKFLQK